jgi:hypothetical protein
MVWITYSIYLACIDNKVSIVHERQGRSSALFLFTENLEI